jgi:hypothetical protein
MRPSVTPLASRCSRGIAAWVIVAGWVMRDSTPPSDSAKWKTRIFCTAAWAASAPSLRVNETIPENPLICLFANACWGWSGRPG